MKLVKALTLIKRLFLKRENKISGRRRPLLEGAKCKINTIQILSLFIFVVAMRSIHLGHNLLATLGGSRNVWDSENPTKEQLFQIQQRKFHLRTEFLSLLKEGGRRNPSTLMTSRQFRNLKFNHSRQLLYLNAVRWLQDEKNRTLVDPLEEHNFIKASRSNRVHFKPKVKYLGILVDSGRHYFPIPWLKRMIHYLYRLRFNMIHFRITDDQAFNLQLASYPNLTMASPTSAGYPKNTNTYTPGELRDLVRYAKKYNITIIPEINVPGHSGAWSGIPDLVLHCPQFACENGYGIPLNVEHDQMKPILKAVIEEVLDIFDPPMLHLGGDEVHKSEECFKELGLKPFQYEHFEQKLEEILQEVGYPSEQVIRWEVTGPNASEPHYRAGKIQHNWFYLPGEQLEVHPNHTYFSSWKLYMDVNKDDGAEQIFRHTLSNFQIHKNGTDHLPDAIIPATFELDTNFWMHRNVVARLIAVAMGAAHLQLTRSEHILEEYDHTCRETLGLPPVICDLQGFIAVPDNQYRLDWGNTWDIWKNGTCDRISSVAES